MDESGSTGRADRRDRDEEEEKACLSWKGCFGRVKKKAALTLTKPMSLDFSRKH